MPQLWTSFTLGDAENWLALGTGALLLLVGASQRSALGACLAMSSAPTAVPGCHRPLAGRPERQSPGRQYEDRPR